MKKFSIILAVLLAVENVYAETFIVDSMEYYISYPAATEACLKSYLGHQNSVTIPSMVTYNNRNYTVTKVGSHCFKNNTTISEVIIPNTIVEIEEECFYGCSNLASINIPSTVTMIGNRCFSHSGLTSIDIPNSISILPQYCFYNCSNLVSVNIPNSITRIEESCFKGCTNLSGNIILHNVHLRYNAFYGCSMLDSVIIYEGGIKSNCFENCTNLKYFGLFSTTLFEDATYIDQRAFANCYNLKTVVLGNTVEWFWNSAFIGCNLDTLVLKNEENIVYVVDDVNNHGGSSSHLYSIDGLVGMNPDSTILVVPCNKLNVYETTYLWAHFWNIIEDCSNEEPDNPDPVGIERTTMPETIINTTNGCISINCFVDGNVNIYDMMGRLVDVIRNGTLSKPLQQGVYLVKFDNNQTRKVIVGSM